MDTALAALVCARCGSRTEHKSASGYAFFPSVPSAPRRARQPTRPQPEWIPETREHGLKRRPARRRYFAVFLAGFAAGAAAFFVVCTGVGFFAGAGFFAVSFFAGAFLAAAGTVSASAVRSTTESSPP